MAHTDRRTPDVNHGISRGRSKHHKQINRSMRRTNKVLVVTGREDEVRFVRRGEVDWSVS